MEDHVSPSAEVMIRMVPSEENVTFSFPKSAEPAVLEADQIGEGAMGSPVPDLPDRDQLGIRGPAAGGQGCGQEQQQEWITSRHSVLYLRFETRDARDTNW